MLLIYIGLFNCHLISSFKKRVESTSEEDGQLQRGLCLNQKYSNGERMIIQVYYNDMFLSPFINPLHSLYPMLIRSHIVTTRLCNISERMFTFIYENIIDDNFSIGHGHCY